MPSYFEQSLLPLSGLIDPSVGLSGLLGTSQTMSGQPTAMGAQAATGVTGMPGGPDLNDLLQSINETPEAPGVGMNMPLGGPIWSLAQQQGGQVPQGMAGLGGIAPEATASPTQLTPGVYDATQAGINPNGYQLTPFQNALDQMLVSRPGAITPQEAAQSIYNRPGDTSGGGGGADPLALLGKLLGLTPKVYDVGKQYFGSGTESGAGTASPTLSDWGQGEIPFSLGGGENFGQAPGGFGTGAPEPGFSLTPGGMQLDINGNIITPESGLFTLGGESAQQPGMPATLGGTGTGLGGTDFGGLTGFGDLNLGQWGTTADWDPSVLFGLFGGGGVDPSSLGGSGANVLNPANFTLGGAGGEPVLNPSDFVGSLLDPNVDIAGTLGSLAGGAGLNLAWAALPIIAKMAGLNQDGLQVVQGLMGVLGTGLAAAGILPASAAGIGGTIASLTGLGGALGGAGSAGAGAGGAAAGAAAGAGSLGSAAIGGALAPFIAFGINELMAAMQKPMKNQAERVEKVGQTGQMQQQSLQELMQHMATAQTPQQIADAVFSFKAAQQYGGEQGGPAGYWGQDQNLGMFDLPYVPAGGGPTRFGIKFPNYDFNPQLTNLNKILDLVEQQYGSSMAGYEPRVWRAENFMPTASFQIPEGQPRWDPQKINPFTGEMGYFWQPGETITDFDTAARLGLGDPGTLGQLREQAAAWQPWNQWAGLTQGAPTIWQMLAQTQPGQPQVNALAQPAGPAPTGPSAAVQMTAPGVVNVQGLRPGGTTVTAPSSMNVSAQGYMPIWDDVTQQWVAAPPGYIQAPPEEF